MAEVEYESGVKERVQGFRGWGVGQSVKSGGPVTWEWCVQGGTRALGPGIKPNDASQDGASDTFTDRKEAGLRGHWGGEGPRRSKDKSQGEHRVRVQGGLQRMADSLHQQESCSEKPAASVRDDPNTGVSSRHRTRETCLTTHHRGEGEKRKQRRGQEGTRGEGHRPGFQGQGS